MSESLASLRATQMNTQKPTCTDESPSDSRILIGLIVISCTVLLGWLLWPWLMRLFLARLNDTIPNGTKYDYRGLIRAPFQILSGGYMAVFDVRTGTGWKAVTADGKPSFSTRPGKGSRRERRFTAKDLWVPSTVK